MLVVGHCPTCLGPLVFSDENVNDITDCFNARIAFSCNSRLLTVDIAFSSGFTPMKEFLECLSIQSNPSGQLFMKVIRYYLTRDETIEYNHRLYDNEHDSWLKYRAVGNSNSNNSNSNSNSNSSNSNSNDDYQLTSGPTLRDIFGQGFSKVKNI